MGGAVGDFVDNTWGSFVDGVEDLGRWVGERLGMTARDETLTDIQVTNLLTPGAADTNARKNCIRGSNGNAKAYSDAYKAFQRNYKRTFNKQFIKSLGYLPSSTGVTRVLDPVAVLDYVQDTDPLADTILNLFIKFITAEEAAYDWMEDNIGWSNQYRTIDIGDGKNWVGLVITDDGTDIQMDFTREAIETIEENLTDNYSYDEPNATVEIGGELYDVPELDDEDLGGYYRTTVTLQSDGVTTEDIDTPIETLNYNISNGVLDGEKMFVKYNRGDTEWYYYIENLSTIPSNLYTTATIDMTAIIPLKENNIIIDGGRKQERMLKKLNLESDMFTDSLNNNEIDSAYILTGIHPGSQSNGGMKTIFTMFDLIQEGSGDISIRMQDLNMTYAFTMDKSTHTGVILDVGKYNNVLTSTSETTDDGSGTETTVTYYTRTLQYQATEDQYKQIVITNYAQTYTISGETIVATFADGADISRMIIPLNVLNRLKYREWVETYEESLAMIAYAEEVVHFEWYQSANFQIIMTIVAVVITIVAIIFAIPSGGSSLKGAELFWFVVIELGKNIAIGLAIGYGIGFVIDYMVQEMGMDPAMAALIVAAASIAIGAMTGYVNTENWLPMATKLTSQSVTAANSEVGELASKDSSEYKAWMDKAAKENDLVLSRLKDMTNDGEIISHSSKLLQEIQVNTPEMLYHTNSMNHLANWGTFTDIDGAIEKVIKVA